MPNSLNYAHGIGRTAVLMACIIGLNAPSLHAESIQLKSGKIIDGKIMDRTDDSIEVDVGMEFPFTYFLDEIQSIDGSPVLSETSDEPIDHEIIDQESAEDTAKPESGILEQAEEPITPDPATLEKNSNIDLDAIELPSPDDFSAIPLTTSPDENAVVENYDIRLAPKDPIPSSNVEAITPENPIPPAITPANEHVSHVDQEPAPSTHYFSNFIMPKLKNLLDYASQWIQIQKGHHAAIHTKIQNALPLVKQKLYEIPIEIRRNFLLAFVVLTFAVYFLVCFPLMRIAKKLGKKFPWLIWVPIIQIFYFIYMAGKRWYWIVFFLIPIINIFLLIIFMMAILKNLGRSRWFILLLLIPGINIFALWFLAFVRKSHI